MPLKHYDVTIGAAATALSTYAARKGVKYALIHNTNGNSAIFVGDSTVSGTSWGHTLASSEECTIGPFSGEAPLWTDEIYISGTQNNVVHVLVVTH